MFERPASLFPAKDDLRGNFMCSYIKLQTALSKLVNSTTGQHERPHRAACGRPRTCSGQRRCRTWASGARRMKGTKAFTSGATALSVSALSKSTAQGQSEGQGEKVRVCVCVIVCVGLAMENMIAGRDVRSL